MERFLKLLGVIVYTTIADWWQKRELKRRLRKGLGREVDGLELTSLKTWMEMPREAPKR
jgi:hypothetical protein